MMVIIIKTIEVNFTPPNFGCFQGDGGDNHISTENNQKTPYKIQKT